MVCIVHQIRDNMLSKGWKSQGGAFLAKIWVRKQFLESDKVNSFDMREKRLPRAWKGTLDRPVSRMLLLGFIQGRLKLIIFFLSFFFLFFLMLLSLSVEESEDLVRMTGKAEGRWGPLSDPLTDEMSQHELRFSFIIWKESCEQRGGGRNDKRHLFPQNHCNCPLLEERWFFPA